MSFDQLIFERIEPVFNKYGFKTLEHYTNFFRFQSDSIEVTLSHNTLDGTSFFEVGRSTGALYPINNSVIKQVFDSDIEIEQVSKEDFVGNIAVFLKKEGLAILDGSLNKLSQLEKFVKRESKTYTLEILEKQYLEAANKAWDNGNYREFIKLINLVNKDNLPKSYHLKYKIANERK